MQNGGKVILLFSCPVRFRKCGFFVFKPGYFTDPEWHICAVLVNEAEAICCEPFATDQTTVFMSSGGEEEMDTL